MTLIHNICMGLSGLGLSSIVDKEMSISAAILVLNWKRTKFLMLQKMHLPSKSASRKFHFFILDYKFFFSMWVRTIFETKYHLYPFKVETISYYILLFKISKVLDVVKNAFALQSLRYVKDVVIQLFFVFFLFLTFFCLNLMFAL